MCDFAKKKTLKGASPFKKGLLGSYGIAHLVWPQHGFKISKTQDKLGRSPVLPRLRENVDMKECVL